MDDRYTVRRVPGVGRMTQMKLLRTYGIAKLGELRDFVLDIKRDPDLTVAQKRAALETFVNRVTRNTRRGVCLEGYAPRLHNRLARDGLIRFMRTDGRLAVPAAMAPPYAAKVRDPADPAFDRGLVEAPHTYEGGWAFPHGGATKPTGRPRPLFYPYGRSSKMPVGITNAARNNLIRNDPRHAARQTYPCNCFRSQATCSDFGPRRGNRIVDPRLPPCWWDGAKCRVVPRAGRPQQRGRSSGRR